MASTGEEKIELKEINNGATILKPEAVKALKLSCMDVAFILLAVAEGLAGESFSQEGQQNFVNNAYAACLGY